MAYTWLQFENKVDEFLDVHANRSGATTKKEALVRACVLRIQRFIPFYTQGHETIFGESDVVKDESASMGSLPARCQPKDAFYVETGDRCVRQPMSEYPWKHRFDLVCGQVPTENCQFFISIDPVSRQFYTYPAIEEGRHVSLFWNGVKGEDTWFADGETVPFDEPMAECVAEYVLSRFARDIDRDREKAVDHYAAFVDLLRQLYVDAKEKAAMAGYSSTPEPLSCETTCTSCEQVQIVETEDDEALDFVIFGDTQGATAGTDEAVPLAESFEPDFLVLLGDLSEDGDAEDLQAEVLDYFQDYINAEKFYPVWGNHDLSNGSLVGTQYGGTLLALFDYIAELNSSKLYYDFEVGCCHFFVINSGYTDGDPREPDGITSGSTQALWLQAALAASDAEWNIVCLHRAPYTSENIYTPGATVMRWPFKTWGADIVFAGHAHNYERLLVDGLPYLVVGTGGQALRGFGAPVDGSQKRFYADYGVTRVIASTTRLQIVHYDTDGNIQDNVAYTKEAS